MTLRFKVSTVICVHTVIFWILTSYCLVGAYHHFEVMCCILPSSSGFTPMIEVGYTFETSLASYKTTRCHNPIEQDPDSVLHCVPQYFLTSCENLCTLAHCISLFMSIMKFLESTNTRKYCDMENRKNSRCQVTAQ
jgi:hypothetical protein